MKFEFTQTEIECWGYGPKEAKRLKGRIDRRLAELFKGARVVHQSGRKNSPWWHSPSVGKECDPAKFTALLIQITPISESGEGK